MLSDPVLSVAERSATAVTIVASMKPSGAIPWPDGHTDAWDHVECAMALLVCGEVTAARSAYQWLRHTQRADGSWATSYDGLLVLDATVDVNQCAYVAVGVWQWYLVTGEIGFVRTLWPTVSRALDLVLRMQAPEGHVRWSIGPDGDVRPAGLLTGSSSMYQSLRCGLALADLLGIAAPEWELAAGRLQHAVAHHPEVFLDKSRFSMDWYYPVLGGCLRGSAGRAQLESRWDEFVVPDLGIRCVSDRPWVTGAETAELALALVALGDTVRASGLLLDAQHLRHFDGSYWTGLVFDEGKRWPGERSSWTSAAMILAADALDGGTSSALFTAADLPTGVLLTSCEYDPCTAGR